MNSLPGSEQHLIESTTMDENCERDNPEVEEEFQFLSPPLPNTQQVWEETLHLKSPLPSSFELLFPELCNAGSEEEQEEPQSGVPGSTVSPEETEVRVDTSASAAYGRAADEALGRTPRWNPDLSVPPVGGWRDCGTSSASVSNYSETSENSERHRTQEDGNDLDRNAVGSEETGPAPDLRREFLLAFQKSAVKNQILHEVYLLPNRLSAKTRPATGIRKIINNTFTVISFHKDHWHVVHDCAYQSNQCRCAFIQKCAARFGQRVGRRLIPRFKFTIQYAVHTVLYLEKGCRQIDYLQIGRKQWSRHVNQARLVRLCTMPGTLEGKLLEDGELPDSLFCFLECPDRTSGAQTTEDDWKGFQTGAVDLALRMRRIFSKCSNN
uniref:Uncharacterized protein n=2 Tax=Cacopsylla melanoneura TaxID=428564 RepID=A0A8D8W1F8_9HEMI